MPQSEKTYQRLRPQDWAMQREPMLRTLVAFADGIELRDLYKVGHQARVAQLAAAIGIELGLPREQQEDLEFAARIHDVGIVAVPAEILNRPTALLDAERKLLRSHAQVGYDLLHNSGFAERVALTLLHHHERLDGSGYPRGLKGEVIVTEARIVGIADVVEAMNAMRAHRPAPGPEAALHEIEENRGRFYDPAAAEACVWLFRKKGFAFAE